MSSYNPGSTLKPVSSGRVWGHSPGRCVTVYIHFSNSFFFAIELMRINISLEDGLSEIRSKRIPFFVSHRVGHALLRKRRAPRFPGTCRSYVECLLPLVLDSLTYGNMPEIRRYFEVSLLAFEPCRVPVEKESQPRLSIGEITLSHKILCEDNRLTNLQPPTNASNHDSRTHARPLQNALYGSHLNKQSPLPLPIPSHPALNCFN